MDLADLFNKYGSDKDRNGYSHLYSILFDNIKNNHMNVLEIGVGTMIPKVCSSMKGYMPDSYKPGASHRAWNDYFPNSKIYGVDIQPDTEIEENNIKTYICSSVDKSSVDKLMEQLNIKFDIIIDDGWHWDKAQKDTLTNFFPYLKEDGLYIIEDIYPGSELNNTTPTVIKNLIGNYEHFFVGLKNNQCVIKKRLINTIGNC
jgi:hypothetical protein